MRRISAYILFALGLITVTFFRTDHGDLLPYPALFWIIGAIMGAAGWAILRYTPTLREEHEKEEASARISRLKKNGEKIRVPFASCTIKSNDFTQEQELFSEDVKDIPAIDTPWDEAGSTRLVEVHESVVIYKQPYRGKEETFMSEIILKDKATLMFLLDQQKETFIYVNRRNRKDYYFDLEFLNNEVPA